jgi:hypothetical protein
VQLTTRRSDVARDDNGHAPRGTAIGMVGGELSFSPMPSGSLVDEPATSTVGPTSVPSPDGGVPPDEEVGPRL